MHLVKHVFRKSWRELDTARSTPWGSGRQMANACAQAAAEQEVAVARCRSSASALDNSRAHAENHCERLEEGFARERDRALQSLTLFLRMWQPSCGMSRLWSPNFVTRRLACPG